MCVHFLTNILFRHMDMFGYSDNVQSALAAENMLCGSFKMQRSLQDTTLGGQGQAHHVQISTWGVQDYGSAGWLPHRNRIRSSGLTWTTARSKPTLLTPLSGFSPHGVHQFFLKDLRKLQLLPRTSPSGTSVFAPRVCRL